MRWRGKNYYSFVHNIEIVTYSYVHMSYTILFDCQNSTEGYSTECPSKQSSITFFWGEGGDSPTCQSVKTTYQLPLWRDSYRIPAILIYLMWRDSGWFGYQGSDHPSGRRVFQVAESPKSLRFLVSIKEISNGFILYPLTAMHCHTVINCFWYW